MDEPTNHLDIWSCEALERSIREFEGTVLVVSHDRYFLNQVADRLIVVAGGRARVIEGDYETYQRLAQQEAEAAQARAAAPQAAAAAPRTTPSRKSEKRKRKFPYRKSADLEREIAEVEAEVAELEDLLGQPATWRDPLKAVDDPGPPQGAQGEARPALRALGRGRRVQLLKPARRGDRSFRGDPRRMLQCLWESVGARMTSRRASSPPPRILLPPKVPMPDPEKLLATVRRATELFRSTPGRRGGSSRSTTADEVMVVGDLHGNTPAFRKVLEVAALARHPGAAPRPAGADPRAPALPRRRRRQVAPARRPGLGAEVPVPRPRPPDPGQPRALRADRPDDRQERDDAQRPVPQGDRDRLRRPRDGEVYDAYRDLFAALPLAVRTPNRVFLCHTIPDPIAPRHARPRPPRGRRPGRPSR